MYYKTDFHRLYDIDVVATHQNGSKFRKLCVMVIGLLKILHILLTRPIDIVHIHCGDIPSPCRKYLCFRICRMFKCKVVLHFHGALFLEQFPDLSGFWKKRLRLFFEGADAFICLSQTWSDDIGRLFPKSNRIVIPNGILLPEKVKIRDESLKLSPKIVFLGSIGQRKGVFDLLSVFHRLVREGYDLQLSIGGNGDIDKLNEMISLHDLKNCVEYLGWINEDQKDRLLTSSDIFVLPSYGEGMPVSILEAMAYGLAVISTPVGGIPDLIDHGETGYMVSPGDLDGLYGMLKTLVEQQRLRRRMGRNARQKVEADYSISKNHQIIGCVYDQLLSNRSNLCKTY